MFKCYFSLKDCNNLIVHCTTVETCSVSGFVNYVNVFFCKSKLSFTERYLNLNPVCTEADDSYRDVIPDIAYPF